MKKILSVFLAFVLVFSGMVFKSVPVFAAVYQYAVGVGDSISISAPRRGTEYAWYTDDAGRQIVSLSGATTSILTVTGLKAGVVNIKLQVVISRTEYGAYGTPYQVPDYVQETIVVTVTGTGDSNSGNSGGNNNNNATPANNTPAVNNSPKQTPAAKTKIYIAADSPPTQDLKQTEIPASTTERIQSFDIYGSTSGNISNGGDFLQIGPARYFYAVNGELKQVEDGITTTITNGVSIFSCLNQVGYWIYYQGDDGICKINIDGSNKKVLDGTSDARYLIYANGWLYYNDNNANRVIKKMKADGTEKQVINNEKSYDIFVIGDWIYYRNYDENTDKRNICKVRTDGTQRTVINSGDCCYLVFDDGYVYYSNFDDGKKLYKMKLDGTGVTKLNDEESNYINVTDSKVIYVAAGRDGVYSINKDGTGRKKEFDINFSSVYAYENNLYFVDEMSGVIYNSTIK